MAGHSQFKNIMFRKGAQDAKRAKIFTKLIREFITAAKTGLPDPALNPRLRSAIQAARKESMPRDKIENAIKRGAGTDAAADNFVAIRYEGYGAGGVAIIVEALTDNRNRTASDLRSIFSKQGGNMGETGSVNFMFDHVGLITFPAAAASEEKMFEAALEAGAENCISDASGHTITTTLESFFAVREALEKAFGAPESAKLAWQPKTLAPIGEEDAQSVMKLIETLEDHDDVQEVFSNFEVSEDVLAKLSA